MQKYRYGMLLATTLVLAHCHPAKPAPYEHTSSATGNFQELQQTRSSSIELSTSDTVGSLSSSAYMADAQLQKTLSPLAYDVLRHGATEAPFTSDLLHETRKGTYVTADCHEPVFRSEQKFDSGTGWPSFWAPISPDAIVLKEDDTLGMVRTEVLSKKCGSHLGHVFDDGPQPTGKRYCINGVALKFVPDAQDK